MSYVNVEFDQPRRLLIDFRAAKQLDRVCGEIGLLRVNELLTSFNIPTLEKVLWAGLLHEEATLSINTVSKRLERYANTHGSLVELFTAAIKAINDSGLFSQQSVEDDAGNLKPEPTT
jgi:hypothetical protein